MGQMSIPYTLKPFNILISFQTGHDHVEEPESHKEDYGGHFEPLRASQLTTAEYLQPPKEQSNDRDECATTK